MSFFINQQIGNQFRSNLDINPKDDVNFPDLDGEWLDIEGNWDINKPYIQFTDIQGEFSDLEGKFVR